MPCSDGGPSECDFYKEWLCEAVSLLEQFNLHNSVRLELQEWWRAHRDREQARARAEAVAKLTPRERLALGLDAEGNRKP